MQISVNTPCYFLTSVAHHRLPIFRTDGLKQVLADALNEARRSSEMLIFAYVIMADHMHIITDSKRTPSETLRYINGISARRIVDHLKAEGHKGSLSKLQQETKAGNYKYSVWEHHSDKFLITGDSMMLQKVHYIHQNPVADGLVDVAENYRFSSARPWMRKALLDPEPIEVDLKEIKWRAR